MIVHSVFTCFNERGEEEGGSMYGENNKAVVVLKIRKNEAGKSDLLLVMSSSFDST
jgi:hypothetical protein